MTGIVIWISAVLIVGIAVWWVTDYLFQQR